MWKSRHTRPIKTIETEKAISLESAIPKMGRSSAALVHTSSGAMYFTLLLLVLSGQLIEIAAQYDDLSSSEERLAENPLVEEDTTESRRQRPFNLIAPRPSSKFQYVQK